VRGRARRATASPCALPWSPLSKPDQIGPKHRDTIPEAGKRTKEETASSERRTKARVSVLEEEPSSPQGSRWRLARSPQEIHVPRAQRNLNCNWVKGGRPLV
jgi:hypothetical protein